MPRNSKTKAEMRRVVAAALKEAEVGSLRALLEAVGPDLTLGELIEFTDNPTALLQIRCSFLSSVIATKTDEPIYGEAKKRKRPRRKTAGNGKPEPSTRQTSIPGTDPETKPETKPRRQAPPRPEEGATDVATDGKRDERVFKMILDANTEGLGSEPILKKLGCTKAQLRYSIGRLRKAKKIESKGEKRAQRHFVVESEAPTQEPEPAPEGT